MANITYYVALPFVQAEDGDLIAGEARDYQSANGASAVRDLWPLSAQALWPFLAWAIRT
jgi:hypothetical protein